MAHELGDLLETVLPIDLFILQMPQKSKGTGVNFRGEMLQHTVCFPLVSGPRRIYILFLELLGLC